jgi:carbonic anhydrase
VDGKGRGGDPLAQAIRLHTQNMAYHLRDDQILKPLQQTGRLRIVGGIYHLESGRVDFIV